MHHTILFWGANVHPSKRVNVTSRLTEKATNMNCYNLYMTQMSSCRRVDSTRWGIHHHLLHRIGLNLSFHGSFTLFRMSIGEKKQRIFHKLISAGITPFGYFLLFSLYLQFAILSTNMSLYTPSPPAAPPYTQDIHTKFRSLPRSKKPIPRP